MRRRASSPPSTSPRSAANTPCSTDPNFKSQISNFKSQTHELKSLHTSSDARRHGRFSASWSARFHQSRAGWAIPAATDIAFAVGVLALLGKRAPATLKIFLLTLAILDDLGAILIIALFYTHGLQPGSLVLALIPLAGLFLLNRARVHRIAPVVLIGVVLWVLVLKSGVHATLAGVVTAFFVPLRDRYGKSPLHSLEHALSPYVLFLIVPVFAFANAGVVIQGLTLSSLVSALPLGIAGDHPKLHHMLFILARYFLQVVGA